MPKKIPNANTQKLFDELKLCARNMCTESYDALAVRIGLKQGAGRTLRLHLKYIRDQICTARGLPHLNQLAVNKKAWLPGDSVLPKQFKIPPEAKRTLWRGMVLQVFVYPWEDVPFDDAEE